MNKLRQSSWGGGVLMGFFSPLSPRQHPQHPRGEAVLDLCAGRPLWSSAVPSSGRAVPRPCPRVTVMDDSPSPREQPGSRAESSHKPSPGLPVPARDPLLAVLAPGWGSHQRLQVQVPKRPQTSESQRHFCTSGAAPPALPSAGKAAVAAEQEEPHPKPAGVRELCSDRQGL